MVFNELPLGDVLDFYNGKSIKPGGEGVFPVYGSNGIIGGCNEPIYSDAIIIGRVGAYCGAVQYCKSQFWASDNTIVAKTKEGYDTQFSYYLLSDMDLHSYAGGAAQPLLTQITIKQVKVKVPSLPTQRRIADILSAYDELIENNTRRIRILEQMAQTIHQEWFGKVDRESLPDGWELVKLGDVADIQWGDTSVTKASYVAEGYTAYSASGADGKLEYYDFDRKGIVLSAIGANCGKTWFAIGKWSCIKNTIRFWSVSEMASTEYLYFVTADVNFWTRRGAAQPFISQGDARNIFIVCPDKKTMDRFTGFASNVLEQINLLEKKNANLRQTRDLLLPRLVSGEIDVPS